MSNSIALDDKTAEIIALLTSSYNPPVVLAAPVKPVKVAAPRANKLKLAKAVKEQEESNPIQSETVRATGALMVTTIPLPAAGTIDAREFFIAMRRAVDRDDRIRAIAAFHGFNAEQSYSANEGCD